MTSDRSGTQLNIVFIGGSLTSMESVCYFVEKQAKTTIISQTKPFEKQFGSEVSSRIVNLHESKGVAFITDKDLDIKEFKESNGVLNEIELADGSSHPCDICIVAMEPVPSTDFLKNTDLKMDKNGFVLVDKHMRTNLNDIYAAGEMTSFPQSCLSGLDIQNISDNINVNYWGLAAQQGRIAALSIVNQTRTEQLQNEFKTVPFFWSTQYGKSIRFSGFNDQFDSVIFHDSKENSLKFAAFYISLNKVVGVCTMDWDPICAIFSEALFNRIEVRKEHIEKDAFDLKKLLLV